MRASKNASLATLTERRQNRRYDSIDEMSK